jgi:hypothetical protein
MTLAIKRSETLFKNKNYSNYKKLRPYMVKLIAHTALLLISIRAYLLYLNSNQSYTDFIDIMNTPVITDVILIDKNKECEEPYESIKSAYIPETIKGCRCDYKVFTDDFCKTISGPSNFLTNFKNCFFEDLVMRGSTPKSPSRILQDDTAEPYTPDDIGLPDTCDCLQTIASVNTTKEINTWIPGKKICILKDNKVTTQTYLSSAFEQCDDENICQRYFCKADNKKENKCPVVDLYFDHKYTPGAYKNSKTSALTYNNTIWNLYATSIYNQSYIDAQTSGNTIYFPLIDIHIGGNGMCVDGSNSFQSSYALLPETNCPLSQRYYSVHKQNFKDVLNNNDNYYDFLASRLPLFNGVLDDSKWSLDLEYPSFRDSLTCLMNYYDNTYPNSNNSTTYTRDKMTFVLQSFITLNKSDFFQNFTQVCLLVLNILVVIINSSVLIYKSVRVFKNVPKTLKQIFKSELFVSFFIDCLIAALGAFAFFSLNVYKSYLNLITETNCLDDFMLYKFNTYSDSLEQTAEQNLQIFVIMMFKLLIVVAIVLHYSCSKKCRFKLKKLMKLLKDNLHDKTVGSTDSSNHNDTINSVIGKKNANPHISNDNIMVIEIQNVDNIIDERGNGVEIASLGKPSEPTPKRRSWNISWNRKKSEEVLEKVPSRSFNLEIQNTPKKLLSTAALIQDDDDGIDVKNN